MFLNKVKIILIFAYIQTRHKHIAGFYVVAMFSKYLSKDQSIKDLKDCA